jgi:hypothetical protein
MRLGGEDPGEDRVGNIEFSGHGVHRASCREHERIIIVQDTRAMRQQQRLRLFGGRLRRAVVQDQLSMAPPGERGRESVIRIDLHRAIEQLERAPSGFGIGRQSQRIGPLVRP